MENPDQDSVVLRAFTSSSSNSRSPEPEQEQKPESVKEEAKTRERPPTFLTMTQLEFRIQQLKNRQLLLLEIQRCKKKEEQSNEETIETIQEDSTEDNEELKNIQTELNELQLKKEELEKRGASYRENTKGHQEQTPRGGIYMLPPLHQDQDDTADDQSPSIRTTPAEILGRTPRLNECPFCNEVVVTETHNTRGDGMWVMCFVCTLMGCVAGCCLIPFFMKQFRNVVHTCPQCQSNIHTHQPL